MDESQHGGFGVLASKAAATLSILTGSPQLSSTMMAVAPQRSTFFHAPPNTPFWQTITVSPGKPG